MALLCYFGLLAVIGLAVWVDSLVTARKLEKDDKEYRKMVDAVFTRTNNGFNSVTMSVAEYNRKGSKHE